VMLLCFQIRVNFTLVLCIACYHFEFGIAASDMPQLRHCSKILTLKQLTKILGLLTRMPLSV